MKHLILDTKGLACSGVSIHCLSFCFNFFFFNSFYFLAFREYKKWSVSSEKEPRNYGGCLATGLCCSLKIFQLALDL